MHVNYVHVHGRNGSTMRQETTQLKEKQMVIKKSDKSFTFKSPARNKRKPVV